MVRNILAIICLLWTTASYASIDPFAVSQAEQWLRAELSARQAGVNAAGVLEATSVLEAISSSGDLLGLRSELLASLENTELSNNDLYARGWLAGISEAVSSASPFIETYQQPNTIYAGWGLSRNYLSSPLDTALVLRVIPESGNEQIIADAVAFLVSSQAFQGGWSLDEDGQSNILVTSQAVLALQRFREHPGVENAISAAAGYLGMVTQTVGALPRAQAAMALHAVKPDSIVANQMIAALVNEQAQDGSWYNDIVTTATVVKLLRAVLGQDADLLHQIVAVDDPSSREQINTQLGRNAYDRITLGDLRLLPALDLTGIQFTSLQFLAGATEVTSLTLPGAYQLTLADISAILSMPNLQSLWLGGQSIDMTTDADGDGLPDSLELIMGTDPGNADSDDDQLPDGWEVRYQFDPLSLSGAEDTHLDPDGDFSVNLDEFIAGTNPTNPGSKPGTVNGVIAYYPMVNLPKYGNAAHDFSDYSVPLDLDVTGGVSWLPGNGVSLSGAGATLIGQATDSKLYSAITASGEFSVEIWTRMAGFDSSSASPARIVSYSLNSAQRNFTLDQNGLDLAARIRTDAGDPNGLPELVAPGRATQDVQHIAMTYDGAVLRMYVNGQLAAQQQRDQLISGWNETYSLILGDEVTGGSAWSGDIYQLTIYDRAISQSEVLGNVLRTHLLRDADQDGVPDMADDYPLDPQFKFDSDKDSLADQLDNCPFDANADQSDVDGDGMGDMCDADADGDGLPNLWEQQSGLDWLNMLDGAELLSPVTDPDGDGYSNHVEYQHSSDPQDGMSLPVVTLESITGASYNDAEEQASGSMRLSDNLEFENHMVGLRFPLLLGDDATITAAYIQFVSVQEDDGVASYQVYVESVDDASVYDPGQEFNISSRALGSSLGWSPDVWGPVGTASTAERTSDISALVSEVLARPGWLPGNHIAFVIDGDGQRKAKSWDTGGDYHSPRLVLQAVVPYLQLLDTDGDGLLNYLDQDDDNDGLPDSWEDQHSLNSLDAADGSTDLTSISDPDGDGYPSILEFRYDSDPNNAQSLPTVSVSVAIGDSFSDVHEAFRGTMRSESELRFDEAAVGLRFAIPLDSSAVVGEAYVQFTQSNSSTQSANYQIAVEAADDASIFDVNTRYNLSSRTLGSSLPWQAGAWSGEQGAHSEKERTPNIASLMNEVLARPGWRGGNHLAFVITGSGNQKAYAKDDGDGSRAPILVIKQVMSYQELLEYDSGGSPD